MLKEIHSEFAGSRDGLYRAEQKGLDLVCVSEFSNPPVCKIIDYSKFRFEKQKEAKLQKRNSNSGGLSEVQFSLVIQQHDLEVKKTTVQRLLSKGNDVRIVLRLRGREVSYMERAIEKMDSFVELCSDIANVKKPVYNEGRDVICILTKKPQ